MIIPGGILTPCRAGTGFSAYSNLIFIRSGSSHFTAGMKTGKAEDDAP
ncbi:hypothetical protein ASZ90_015083 [hydrocarbon metagenome]|uniref:Uncharacterized protein n=1 Tax=hydrocarbon metagenome TaxID=938273 RepID=A0A0W8F373_9ZZZZ